jgi:Fe-S-cluster containining protein
MAEQQATQPINSAANRIAAGSFGEWLVQIRASLRGEGGTDVPCGECVGCCVSSYFIPVRPEDKEALAVIPANLLVTAPGQKNGNVMMGYREDGTCPMLNSGKCSIYQQRPQTCRDYDCRIFAAAGIDAGGNDKHVINRRVREWQFIYSTEAERLAHNAVLAAATFIKDKGASFPSGRAPTASTGIAVLAIKTYAIFLGDELAMSETEIANAIVKASREFDASTG